MSRRRKILLVIAGAIAVALVVGISGWRHLSNSSSAVSVGKAVSRYEQTRGAATAGPPLPGVYTYSVHGQECAGVSAFRLCRTFPAQARAILTRKANTISVELDLSEDHTETSRYDVRADGRYLSWQSTRIVFGIAQESTTDTTPETLALPATLRAGQHWTQRFSAGGMPVVTVNTVTGKAPISIGGTRVAAYEVNASSTTGGDHPGTETDVTWHDPGSGLDVRLIVHRRIGGVFPYTMDVDATLQSLRPVG